jgi:hypothetical protein
VAWSVFVELYVLGMAASGLNWIRTIAAHGYRNTGSTMSFVEQIEDSNTVTGHPLLTELLFPVGLRYHCLHHMLPSLPYHSLGIAHRRLMAQLPADSPYRSTIRRGFLETAGELWRSASTSQGFAQLSCGSKRPAKSSGAARRGERASSPVYTTARRKR